MLLRTLGKPVEWGLIERLESLEKNMEAAAASPVVATPAVAAYGPTNSSTASVRPNVTPSADVGSYIKPCT